MVHPLSWFVPCLPLPSSLPSKNSAVNERDPILSRRLPESTALQNFISRQSHPFPSLYFSPYAESQSANNPPSPEFELDSNNPYRQIRNLYFWQAQCLLWVKESVVKGRKTINPYESAHIFLKMKECRFKPAAEMFEALLSPNTDTVQIYEKMKKLATLAEKCVEHAARILREPIVRGMLFGAYARVIPNCECNGLLTADEAANIIERADRHMAISFPYYDPERRLGGS